MKRLISVLLLTACGEKVVERTTIQPVQEKTTDIVTHVITETKTETMIATEIKQHSEIECKWSFTSNRTFNAGEVTLRSIASDDFQLEIRRGTDSWIVGGRCKLIYPNVD